MHLQLTFSLWKEEVYYVSISHFFAKILVFKTNFNKSKIHFKLQLQGSALRNHWNWHKNWSSEHTEIIISKKLTGGFCWAPIKLFLHSKHIFICPSYSAWRCIYISKGLILESLAWLNTLHMITGLLFI